MTAVVGTNRDEMSGHGAEKSAGQVFIAGFLTQILSFANYIGNLPETLPICTVSSIPSQGWKVNSVPNSRKIRRLGRFLIGVSALLAFAGSSQVQAQKQESIRKVVYRVDPRYPQDLRKNGIGGIVRLSVVINSRGTVDKVSPIGGNAALIDAAVLAVKQWKYVPAEGATTAEVQIDFVPKQ